MRGIFDMPDVRMKLLGASPSPILYATVWPSGLRRWLKAPFRKGVGSNPTAANFKDMFAAVAVVAIWCTCRARAIWMIALSIGEATCM